MLHSQQRERRQLRCKPNTRTQKIDACLGRVVLLRSLRPRHDRMRQCLRRQSQLTSNVRYPVVIASTAIVIVVIVTAPVPAIAAALVAGENIGERGSIVDGNNRAAFLVAARSR